MTPKQEAFARAYVETGSASEAYRQSYDAKDMKEATVWKRSSELLQHGEVAGRVNELREMAQNRTAITIQHLTDLLTKALTKAEAEPKGASAMVSAVMGIGKLHGLVTEKREVTHKQGVEDADDRELTDIALAGRRGTTQATPGSSQPN